MNVWVIIGAVWVLGMALAWALVHGSAKLRAEEEALLADTPVIEDEPITERPLAA